MELFASAPGLAVEESYVRLLNHLPGLAYRCRVGRTDPIVSERLEYTLEFVSKGSYDLLGIPAEDMVRNNNNTIERMMHPDDLQKTRRNMYDSIVAHQPYQVMYRVSLPSGRLKWIWDQGEGVFDADGELRYLEGLMMDISEQKFQELELKEENRQLKASVSNLYGLGNIVGKSEAMRRASSSRLPKRTPTSSFTARQVRARISSPRPSTSTAPGRVTTSRSTAGPSPSSFSKANSSGTPKGPSPERTPTRKAI